MVRSRKDPRGTKYLNYHHDAGAETRSIVQRNASTEFSTLLLGLKTVMQTWRLCWKKDLQTATSSNWHPSTGFVMHHGCSKLFKTPFSFLPSDAQSDTNIISVPKTPTNHLHGEKASNPVQWLTLKQCTIDMKHYDQICNLKGWPTIWHHIHQARASSSVSYTCSL